MATSPTPSHRNGRLAPLEREGSDPSSVGLPPGASAEGGLPAVNVLAVPSAAPVLAAPSAAPVLAAPSAAPVLAAPSTAPIIRTGPIAVVKDPNAPAPRFEEESMRVGNSVSEGIHTFGIGKAGISRAVVIFSKPPPPQPYAVCFHFPNTFLSHAYVLHCIYDVIKDVAEKGKGIASLSFRDRNVLHGCTGLENRWIVNCQNLTAKETLIERGLALCNKRVLVRNLDDVIEEEYADYTRYKSHRTKLYGNVHEQLKKLTGGL